MVHLFNRALKAGRWFCATGLIFCLLIPGPQLALAAEPAAGARAAAVEPAAATGASSDPANGSSSSLADGAIGEGAPGKSISDETLLVDVRINGRAIGKIGEFVKRNGTLMVRPSELRDLGVQVPDSLVLGSRDLIAMSDVHGLSFNLDERNMVMNITAGDDSLTPTTLQTFGQHTALTHREIESGTGVTLNYDALGTFSGGKAGLTGSTELRAFSRFGVASSNWLGYAGATSNSANGPTAVRLDSSYQFADANSLRRYTVGDYINSGLSWTRPVRMEGFQVRSDFSMRPDLITFPLPTVKGSTAVPSTVEVLADGNLAASSHVAGGPFQVPQLPVVSGAGTISMTVTNALGQQVTTTQPFYASTDLLAPGLKTFAAQGGMVRRNWGSVSNKYGKFAGAAMYRRGMTPTFTLEGSAEGTEGAMQAGAGGVKQIGHLGVVNFAAAASGGWGHSGGQITAGAQRIGRTLSLGGSATLASSDYRDVAAMNGDGVARQQVSAFTGLNLKRFGTLGAVYAGIDRDPPAAGGDSGFREAQHSRVLSGNYSYQFHRATIYASEFKDFSGNGGSGLQVGITIPFGRRASASITGTSDGTAQMQAQRAATQVGEWGYNGYVSAGNTNHAFGQVQYKSPVGLFTAGADESSGAVSARLEAQGAVSLTDGAVFPSNTIYDSFAVVDTGSVPHVRVLQENREVGKTNSSGKLLVPDMRAFDVNHLSINPTDIPPDVTMDTDAREIRPQDRSGVVVKFPVKVSHAAMLKLVDEAGKPLEMGGVANLAGSSTPAPIGYDGDAYVADLGDHNELSVERKDGKHCSVSFAYKPVAGDIPSIGPLRCVEKEAQP
ncbi:MAG TPA: fimbria/pilus outer membrane usher protein [Terracidiphilus sp.]|nr:fimbria/pilus outer membrane usher protein [Terracidiphilus sp.]